MYTDISRDKISIHNLTVEEALLVSQALNGQKICEDKRIMALSERLYRDVVSVLKTAHNPDKTVLTF